ncbi:MAG: hypothetical protein HQK83_04685 [Fibrobacteria bacterium]|nr:hypothetical protein [Fibrobacteria bacterium]
MRRNNSKRFEERKRAVNEAIIGRGPQFYKDHGENQGKNKNFECWLKYSHSKGTDKHPSLHVSDDGQHFCFGCGQKGNTATYYKKRIANTSKDLGNGSYLKHMEKYLGIETNKERSTPMFSGQKKSEPAIMADYRKENIKQETLATLTNNLISNKEIMELLKTTRGWTEEGIRKCKVGYDPTQDCITFPLCNYKGDVINIQEYRPWKNSRIKWKYRIKGRINPPFNLEAFNE